MPGFGGTIKLGHVVSKCFSMKAVLSSDRFGAIEAKNLGIVTDIFKKEDLHNETIKLAKR